MRKSCCRRRCAFVDAQQMATEAPRRLTVTWVKSARRNAKARQFLAGRRAAVRRKSATRRLWRFGPRASSLPRKAGENCV
jgi:hypothetical protein